MIHLVNRKTGENTVYGVNYKNFDYDKDNPTHIYIGRAMPRYGLKASPLANAKGNSLKEYRQWIEDNLSVIVYSGGWRGIIEWRIQQNLKWMKEILSKHGVLYLVYWCKKEMDDDTPCHGDIIKEILEKK